MKKLKQMAATVLAVSLLLTMFPANVFAKEAVRENVDTEWYNFRNNPENNGVTDRPTPIEAKETVQKWAKKYGEGWAAAPTPPLILNKKIYIGVANQIIEIDKETGKEIRRSDEMIGNVGYAMNPITYADGKLFVQVGNGVIQAVDYQTLKSVWYSEKIGGQTISPISYAKIDGKGYIYSGTWANENRDGSYFCIATDDKDTVPVEGEKKGGGKEKKLTWKFTPSVNDKQVKNKRGFYWAGAYATENYIAVGSDDGAKEGNYTEGAVFYTLDSRTGKIIDSISGIKGDIRTTTVYDNGYLYFATKGGVLYKTKVDHTGKLSETSSIDIGAVTNEKLMATAAPLVYKNKIYMGVSGAGGQFDPDAGHTFSVIDNRGKLTQNSVLYNLPIKGYPQAAALASTAYANKDFDGDGKADGRVYLYFTYNATPGGIYYCYDTQEQTEAKPEQYGELFVPRKEQQQYCISTICADREGTLYYKNDSCYLMAIQNNPAYVNNIVVKGGENENITWNTPFDSSNTEYELKIPASMKKATIQLEMNAGMSATVNEKEYTGKNEITLEEGDKKVQIEVSKTQNEKKYTRTYVLNFVRLKAISTLASMKVGNSNSFNGFLNMTPEFSSDITEYKVDTTHPESFWRVWLKPTDVNAKMNVTSVENIDKITTAKGNPSTQGHDRWNVYKKDKTKSAKIRVDVLSENGEKTTSYTLTLEVPIKVTGLVLDQEKAQLDVTEKLQLNAKVAPDNATVQTVKWNSANEEIATVDEKGMVTPKKSGTVEITVVATDNPKAIAKCQITITDKAKEVDDLIHAIGTVTLESKSKIDIARDAYKVLTDKQKERVTKLGTLEAAEKEYARLKDEAEKEEVDQAAAKAVDELIEKIGEVTVQSGKQIQQAKEAFEKLTPNQKEKVKKVKDLKAAEEKYAQLLLGEEKEKAKNTLEKYKDLTVYRPEQQEILKKLINEGKTEIANASTKEEIAKVLKTVMGKMDAVKTDAQLTEEEQIEKAAEQMDVQISNIGKVQFTSKSRDAILFARVAYDKLEKNVQEKVKNYSILLKAEKEWKNLEANAKIITIVDEKSNITVSGKFMDDFVLHVEKASTEEESILRKEFASLKDKVEKLFVPYTISYDGGYIGEININIPVEDGYNGRNVIVKQLCGDGDVVSHKGIVKENNVLVKNNTLGTFMVGVEKGKKLDANTGEHTEGGLKKPNQNASVPKTADTFNWMLWVGICILSMVTIVARKRFKQN
ncbi:Ig-like domain-containing protein [Faecalimonas sp.]